MTPRSKAKDDAFWDGDSRPALAPPCDRGSVGPLHSISAPLLNRLLNHVLDKLRGVSPHWPSLRTTGREEPAIENP
jgi:hypothetical protein